MVGTYSAGDAINHREDARGGKQVRGESSVALSFRQETAELRDGAMQIVGRSTDRVADRMGKRVEEVGFKLERRVDEVGEQVHPLDRRQDASSATQRELRAQHSDVAEQLAEGKLVIY